MTRQGNNGFTLVARDEHGLLLCSVRFPTRMKYGVDGGFTLRLEGQPLKCAEDRPHPIGYDEFPICPEIAHHAVIASSFWSMIF